MGEHGRRPFIHLRGDLLMGAAAQRAQRMGQHFRPSGAVCVGCRDHPVGARRTGTSARARSRKRSVAIVCSPWQRDCAARRAARCPDRAGCSP